MKKGEKIITEITKFDHQGRGISKQEEKVIFVPNTLPGEIVQIELDQVKKNIAFGHVIKWKKESDDRIESICPYFMECGGCDLLHMTYQKQLEVKQTKIKEIMQKFASYDGPINAIIPSENQLHYRNKVTFHVKKSEISLVKKQSNENIPIKYCYLIDEKMNQLVTLIKNTLPLTDITSITVRKSFYTEDIMIILETEKKDWNIDRLKPFITSIILKNKQGYQTIYGENTITEKLHQLSFKISPDAFFQVNTTQAENLYKTVKEMSQVTKNDKVLDLYCGTGTIALYLSQYAKEVVGIELNENAIKNANENKKINQATSVSFLCGDVGTVLSKINYQPDIVVVDPPRAGLNEQALKEIKKMKASKLVYVSCDPVTLARDIKALTTDYQLSSLTPVDMFPGTMHVECVCVLKLCKPL